MPLDNKYEELYWVLNRIYCSEHSDSPEEAARAIDLLQIAIETHYHSIDTIITKMKQLINKLNQEGSWKPKLSVAIYGRFWEKTLVTMIESRKFKME